MKYTQKSLGIKGVRKQEEIERICNLPNWFRRTLAHDRYEPCDNAEILKALKEQRIERVFYRQDKIVVKLNETLWFERNAA